MTCWSTTRPVNSVIWPSARSCTVPTSPDCSALPISARHHRRHPLRASARRTDGDVPDPAPQPAARLARATAHSRLCLTRPTNTRPANHIATALRGAIGIPRAAPQGAVGSENDAAPSPHQFRHWNNARQRYFRRSARYLAAVWFSGVRHLATRLPNPRKIRPFLTSARLSRLS